LDIAAALKRENPGRAAAQVARILRRHLGWGPSESTVLRHLTRLEPAGPPPREATVFGSYSYLSVCTGSNLAARFAGSVPKRTPTMTDVVVPITELERRTIRRSDWVPCNSAFIDCRTPGSDRKENYAFIGAGVSQNANQYVNLTGGHGFNLGAAGMPIGSPTTCTCTSRPRCSSTSAARSGFVGRGRQAG
jgi:hypothetical protein